MKTAAIATVVSCLAVLLLTLPAFRSLVGHLDFLFKIIHEDMAQAGSLEGNAATHLNLRFSATKFLMLTPFALPILLVAASATKAIRYLATGRPRIGLAGGAIAVLSAVYLLPVGFAILALPEEMKRLAPLGIGLASSAVFLVACARSQSSPEPAEALSDQFPNSPR